MLTLDRFRHVQTREPLRGFAVRNRRGKTLAIGALPGPGSPGFVVMHARRYERDLVLCRAVRALTGLAPRGVALPDGIENDPRRACPACNRLCRPRVVPPYVPAGATCACCCR